MSKISIIEHRVKMLMHHNPEMRDNDKVLVATYLARHHCIYTFLEYCQSKNAPALETITRCRRKLQAQGFGPATPSVKEVRSEQEHQHREFARGK